MKIKFAKQWDAVSQLWKKFYPITITSAVVDADRGQRMNATLADLYTLLGRISYKDVYIGTGATYISVMVAANHHDVVMRGDKFTFTASNDKVRIVLPSIYTPTLMMSGVEVPIALNNTITVDEKEYKVWATSKTFTGTFDVFMF